MYYNMSGTIPPGNGYIYTCVGITHVCLHAFAVPFFQIIFIHSGPIITNV